MILAFACWGFCMNYSDRIMGLRAQLQISQQQLADMVGVNQATIHRWESGQAVPSRHTLPLLEKLLKRKDRHHDDTGADT